MQHTSATISWSTPDYVPASYPIITYEVGYYTSSDNCCASSVDMVSDEISAVMNTTSLTMTLHNLMSGICHVFAVRGYTEFGPGPWRGVMEQTPPAPIIITTIKTTYITYTAISTTIITTCTDTTVAIATPANNESCAALGMQYI